MVRTYFTFLVYMNANYICLISALLLGDNRNRGSFHIGASRIPGVGNHNQLAEVLFNSIKTVVSTKATTENFIRQSIPSILIHLRLTFKVVQVIRDCSSQKHRVKNCHIHRDILNAAYETLRFKLYYRKVVEKGKISTSLNKFYISIAQLYSIMYMH